MLNRVSSELTPAARFSVLSPSAEIDGQSADVVEQRQRVVARTDPAGEVAAVDVLDIGDSSTELVPLARLSVSVPAPRSTTRPETSLLQGEEIVQAVADEVLDVEQRHALELRAEVERVVAGAEIDDRIVVEREDRVGHRQHVVGCRSVDVLDVEDIDERVGACGKVQRVVAVGEVDRHAGDVVEQRQGIVASFPRNRCR